MPSVIEDTEEQPRGIWQWFAGCPGGMTELDRRNQRRFLRWVLIWGASYIGAAVVLVTLGVRSGPMAWTAAGVPDLVGIGAIMVYLRFLRQADELLRRIQLESLALGFGAGVVFALGYRLFELAGAPKLDVDDPALVMLISWSFGQWLAMRRYR